MTLTLPDFLVAVVLFSCVPLQYILVQNWGNTESSRAYAINRFINRLVEFRDNYLVFNNWKRWLFQLLKIGYFYPLTDDSDDVGESPAIEVMKYKQKNGFFAFSPEPRTYRSPEVKLRVGQVVIHKNWKYRGVVIGWDEKAKAPEEWLDNMHGPENKRWRNMPNYSILVDIRDRIIPQMTYVPQENIDVVKNVRIIHPSLDDHFENYDGAQYIPRPWLRTLYPQD